MAGFDNELRRNASAEQRIMETTRRHYRRFGGSPSYGELQAATGINPSKLTGLLQSLERQGLVRREKGAARAIVLVQRIAMVSDVELELEAHRRGATIIWPSVIALPIAEAFSPVLEINRELPLDALLAQIDAADEGGRHGGEHNTEAGTGRATAGINADT